MSDLNTMMRQQALGGLHTQLDAAVTNGDTEAARKISDDIAKLTLQTAPKAPPFGQAEITAELDKHAWFGVDPKKSAKAVELGKTMDPKKFATAAAFAEALVKAVEDDGALPPKKEEPPEDETDEEREARETEEAEAAERFLSQHSAKKGQRKTDAPGEGDALSRGAPRARSGPWTKLSEAPADVQKEINRQADKFVPKGKDDKANKEAREKFVTRALESSYAMHQRKGKK